MSSLGASFSLKYARELDIDPYACLKAALYDLGVKHLRLMSYWDLHEPTPGAYDFKELDWQFALAKKYNAQISLAVGLRQPRWPETHWSQWAKEMSDDEWQDRLLKYLETVVLRYKDHPALESWQLENEALLKTFGLNGNFDRKRLIKEFASIKQTDPEHPVIMSLSDSYGLPFRKPIPDIYAMSLYRRVYGKGKYHISRRGPKFYKARANLIKLITGRKVFIHELQTEPWGPKATSELTLKEQNITMNAELLKNNVRFAKDTGLLPSYLWGAEWWYWMKTKHNDPSLWNSAKEVFAEI